MYVYYIAWYSEKDIFQAMLHFLAATGIQFDLNQGFFYMNHDGQLWTHYSLAEATTGYILNKGC